MSAYFMLDMTVVDPDKTPGVRQPLPRAGAEARRRVIVQSTADEAVEGEWKPQVLAIVFYPNRQAIHDLYNDPECARLLRHEGANTNAVIVDEVSSAAEASSPEDYGSPTMTSCQVGSRSIEQPGGFAPAGAIRDLVRNLRKRSFAALLFRTI